MRTFKDASGRSWVIEFDVWVMKQVAARTGVQLARMLDNNMQIYGELVQDPAKFVDVLFVLVGDQAEKKGVGEEQFFRGLQGDALEGAYSAFWDAFADFCPRHLREILRATTERAKVASEKKLKTALETLRAMDEEPALTSSNSATSSPASPESIPEG